LGNADLAHHQPQDNLAVVHVLANRPLRNLALGQFVLHPRPDAVRRVPLFAWRLTVGVQNRVDKLDGRLQLPSGTLRLFPRPRQSAANRFPHHPPVHTQLLRYPHDRPDPELVLPADLFE
jgi:hypothetical protein